MYIKQIANTLRTFGECFLNTHEIECEHSANSPRPPRNWCEILRQFPTSTMKLVAKHSVRRRGPIHRARILTLPITHIRITTHAFPHYQIRVFISPRTHLCITISIYSFFVVYNIEYKTTQYSIYIHVNCINCFLGYFLIKIQNVPYTPPYIYVCTLISFSRLVEIVIQLSSLFPASNPDLFHLFTVFIHRMEEKKHGTPNFHFPKLYQTMHGQNNLLSQLPLHSHPICRNHIAFS